MGSLIQMGASGIGAIAQYKLEKGVLQGQKKVGQANLDAQNLLNEVNTNAANVLRGENNTLLAAKSALANLQRSSNNQEILRATGEKVNAAGNALTRLRDARTASTLEQRLSDAENQGAVTAAAAASGTGGSGARMLKLALEASAARKATQADAKGDQQEYDLLLQRAGLMSGVIQHLDQGQTFAPIDLTRNDAESTKVLTPMWEADYQGSMWQAIERSMSGHQGAALNQIYKYADKKFSSTSTKSPDMTDSGSDWSRGNSGSDTPSGGYGAGNYGD